VEGAFVTVARAEDVPPGSVQTVRAGDEEIALAHCNGGFYAVQQHCLHLKGPLGVRTGQNEFDLAIQLRTYDVQVEDGEVRVRL
jgi:nitrite reductase/ring-hydroxylating ferredoxin subunit